MILYLDTSALLKLYIREEYQEIVVMAMRDASLVALSVVAYAEARSALARKHRELTLTTHNHERLIQALDHSWPGFDRILTTNYIVRSAGILAEELALRGFDAIHLASALRARDRYTEPVHFLTFDTRLMDAARQVMPVYEWEEGKASARD